MVILVVNNKDIIFIKINILLTRFIKYIINIVSTLKIKEKNMAKRKMPINRNWKRWSASKLGSALACPLRCFFQSMLKIESPSNAAAALGQGMHYMFERFYKPHKNKIW